MITTNCHLEFFFITGVFCYSRWHRSMSRPLGHGIGNQLCGLEVGLVIAGLK